MSNLASLFDRYKALVIFDTETSGLNPGDDQIIELAALRVERTQAGALRIAGKRTPSSGCRRASGSPRTSSPSPASPIGCWRPRACRVARPSAASSSWSSPALS